MRVCRIVISPSFLTCLTHYRSVKYKTGTFFFLIGLSFYFWFNVLRRCEIPRLEFPLVIQTNSSLMLLAQSINRCLSGGNNFLVWPTQILLSLVFFCSLPLVVPISTLVLALGVSWELLLLYCKKPHIQQACLLLAFLLLGAWCESRAPISAPGHRWSVDERRQAVRRHGNVWAGQNSPRNVQSRTGNLQTVLTAVFLVRAYGNISTAVPWG